MFLAHRTFQIATALDIVSLMSCSCNQCIFDQLSTPNMQLCHENRTHILWKKYRPTLTNNLNLHNFLLITESGSLSYWTQHAKLYKWGKFHALIIFWKLLQLSSWTNVAVYGRDLYLVKPTLGPPKKFQHLTRAEEVVITRLRIGHTKATKSHILSRGPPTGCHHCGQTLTIDHMLLECALLQECRDEYYTVDSLNALFETIPETCIVEFLREAGFFYLIWCNLLTSTSPQYWTIWSDLSNCLENESNSETHSLV